MKRLIIIVACLLLPAVACWSWWHWALLRPATPVAVDLEIAEGATQTSVLRQLAAENLLPSMVGGRLYIHLFANHRSVHFGRYRVPAASRPIDVLERILDGRVETIELTIIEGLTESEVAERCVAAGVGSTAEWQATLARADWIQDLAPGATTIEGFLFPETYRFSIGSSAAIVAQHMVSRFRRVWQEELAAASPPWGSPYEVVTLASLVEAETSLASERPTIAGVFVNRLQRGMLLQCDPTVVYALKLSGQWQGRLLRLHWQLDHPYNTYRYPGLPPGPINSPGRQALRAALAPERHRYLYFVASPTGGHTFSETLKEHNRAVARLQRARR
jgi:UPF0755 protein